MKAFISQNSSNVQSLDRYDTNQGTQTVNRQFCKS